MVRNPAQIRLYHITAIDNLPSMVAGGYVFSDARLAEVPHQVIGYSHIKWRRLNEYRVDCCNGRFVGEFVPFYYCPRSPMLSTLNRGNVPGRQAGCQKDIVHLVTTLGRMTGLGHQWAISDGNAGSASATFSDDLTALNKLRWDIIESTDWGGARMHFKQSEFLVGDYVPWSEVTEIGCYDAHAQARVQTILAGAKSPQVNIYRGWYY